MKLNSAIYVICPDRNQPIGGVKQLYRLVDTLNSLGHNAYILHKKKNFRVSWYNNQTPIVYFPGVFKILNKHRKHPLMRFIEGIAYGKSVPKKGSIIVFPEVYGPYINLFDKYSVVIYNQNCYYTFDQCPQFTSFRSPYDNANLLGCMVVSENSKLYLNSFYPRLNVNRIRLGLSSVFNYSANKQKKIAFMPRKLAEDANQIYQFFIQKEFFSEWQFVPIDGKNETAVADILKECAIFMSFNHREGFGLPPVEAMACGCYVVGYAGNAGKEYMLPEFSAKIEDRNIIQFVQVLEETVKTYNKRPQEIIRKGFLASKYVLNIYNEENEIADTTSAWNNITKN